MNFFKKHIKGIIIFVVIAGLLVGGYLYLRSVGNKAIEALTQDTVETAVVEKRKLVNVVPATGKIVSLQSKDVAGTATGLKIKEIMVDVGDEVKAGDVLFTLDSDNIEKSLENARISLENTQKTQKISVSAAQRNYNDTVNNTNTQVQRYTEKVAEAEKDIDEAKALRDQYENIYKNQTEAKDAAYANYTAAVAAVGAIDVSSGDVSANQAALSAAEANLKICKTALDAASSAQAAALSNYQAYITKVETLESSYKTLLQSRDDAAVSLTASLAASKDQLNTAKISQSSSTLSLEQQVETYEAQLENCTVTAPIDGIITRKNIEPDTTYTGMTAFTIEDISAYDITTEIDEYDIGKIKKGQKVVIKTNGTGDEELQGYVKTIAPRATVSPTSTAVTYTVVVAVETKNDALRLDMTAKLSIILEDSGDALTVPYDAVLTDEDDNRYVEIVEGQDENGALITRKVIVKVGIENDYYTQIISTDIKVGDEVKVTRAASTVFDLSQFLNDEGAMGGM